MALKENSFIAELLDIISEASNLLPLPFETKYSWASRLRGFDQPYFYTSVNRLKDKGYIKVTQKNSKKFLKITKKGQLELLFVKAKLAQKQKWDKKWRMAIFDIPEDHRHKRSELRMLLKKNGFKKLQASVYISPFKINREAVKYLKKTGLISFIRFVRVDEMDSDKDIKKMFKLK